MRKYLRPVLIGFVGFLLGIVFLYGVFRMSPEISRATLGLEEKHAGSGIVPAVQLAPREEEEETGISITPPVAKAPKRPLIPSLLGDDDEDMLDPFVALQKMHEDMQKQLRGDAAGVKQSIIRKEDDKSVSFEIRGIDNSSLNTHVESGYLTITAETKSVGKGSFHQSMIQQSLPLPPNVDASKMETLSEKDKVILRFPKNS